ncbi:relaxase/mobilization nuclease domain-containing protein [Paraburkholderia humisilvae]|uniref:relaxase/mobilization nuclease domain-containing protein n=1 Tax=Paraburkholderia humisilvae TaxID=627669 RepID=UPI001581E5A3|nr:relaxase/mobilization nuclease domain-containing protein [Paraburkholderia humisilvae]
MVVKISGGGRGMKAIRAHLDYISRNGKVALENQDGDALVGRNDIRDLKTELQFGGFGIPEESTVREAFNIVLSMPPGTDRTAVHDSVRSFAAKEFGESFRYVFACHTDEAHPHVHLCVIARSNDGTRLNPRKADLQDWRESFAAHLREHGIDANATRRLARGVTKVPVPQPVVNMQKKRGTAPERQQATPDLDARHTQAGGRSSTGQKVLRAYGAMAKAMAESEDVEDRKMAVEIVKLVKQMPSIQHARMPREPDRPDRSGSPRLDAPKRTVQNREPNGGSDEPSR